MTFSASRPGFFRGKFMGSPLFMSRFAAYARDLAPLLLTHPRKTAPSAVRAIIATLSAVISHLTVHRRHMR